MDISAPLNHRKKIQCMAILCLNEFFISICFAIISPFFPHEAESKNVPQFWIGAVFGVFQGIQFIISPFFGLYMYKFGVKKLYLWGIGIDALSTLLFGLTNYIPQEKSLPIIFISSTLILRTLQGLGCSAYITSSYLITVYLFPNNIGTAFGIVETFAGLGFALGPPIGGYLYMLGGYPLPFLVISTTLSTFLVIAIKLIPLVPSSPYENGNGPILKSRPADRTKFGSKDESLLEAEEDEETCDFKDIHQSADMRPLLSPNTPYQNGYSLACPPYHEIDALKRIPKNTKSQASSVNYSNGNCYSEKMDVEPLKDGLTLSLSNGEIPRKRFNLKHVWLSPIQQLSSITRLFKLHYSIGLDYLLMCSGSLTVSFIDSTLEPHLRSISSFWENSNGKQLDDGLTNSTTISRYETLMRLYDIEYPPPAYVMNNLQKDASLNATAANILNYNHPLNSATIGTIFFVLSSSYTISALIFGALTDCKRICGIRIKTFRMIRYMLLISSFLSALALMISGIPILEYRTSQNYTHTYSRFYDFLYKIMCLFPNRRVVSDDIGQQHADCAVPMFFDKTTSLTAICVSQILLGMTFAAQIVFSFADIMKRVSSNTINHSSKDLQNDVTLLPKLAYKIDELNEGKQTKGDNNPILNGQTTTYQENECDINQQTGLHNLHSLVSGLYSSAIALGAFCGPIFAGISTGHGAKFYSRASDYLSLYNVLCLSIGSLFTAYQLGKSDMM